MLPPARRSCGLAYKDGRNSFDTLTPTFRALLAKDVAAFLREFDGGTGEELTPDLLRSRVTMPVKLMLGAESPGMFPALMTRLQAIFPSAPLIVIPGGNHLAMMDCPEAFASSALTALGAGYDRAAGRTAECARHLTSSGFFLILQGNVYRMVGKRQVQGQT